jgi:hypothetical protein
MSDRQWSVPTMPRPPRSGLKMRAREFWVHIRTPCCGHATRAAAEAAGWAHLPGCESQGNPWLFAREVVSGLVYVVTGKRLR